MNLKPSPKIFQNYKCDYPENTIKKIEIGFEKIGLDLTYKEKFIKSLNSSIYSGYSLIDIIGGQQEGKGTTKILSKASAYAEMAERFSTGFLAMKIPLPEKSYKFRKILEDVTEKRFLRGYTKSSDHKSTSFESMKKYYQKDIAKDRYHELKNSAILDTLVDAFSLIKNKYVKVPIHFIESNSSSNGFASGNTYEEAIVQASFELFERYSACKILFEKIECPTIDIKTIKDKKIQGYIKMFESLNVETFVKDFSLKNKLPVIGLIFINHNFDNTRNKLKKDRYYVRIKAGSHCNLNEAIIRCFTEYSQNVDNEEILRCGSSDLLYDVWTKHLNKDYRGIDEELKYFTRHSDYYGDVSFLEEGDIISFNNLKSYKNSDSLDDVKVAIDICKKNDWDFMVIDYTHKILQFPTIRVIIPPISTDYDPFRIKCEKIKDLKERFNYFYGIKDFYNYITDDSWIKDKEKIRILITNIEDYISKELDYYQFYFIRENYFYQLVNLFHILALLHMAINEYEQAKKYFEALIKIGFHPPVESIFFKSLGLNKYNPVIYNTYIHIINKLLEGNSCPIDFELKNNPFDLEKIPENIETMYSNVMYNINKSFK